MFKAILFSNSTKACCAVTATVTSALLTQEALFTVHRYISVLMLSLHKSTAKFPFLCGLCFACSAACDHRCAGGRPPYARCAAVVAVRVCDGASGPWRGLLAESFLICLLAFRLPTSLSEHRDAVGPFVWKLASR